MPSVPRKMRSGGCSASMTFNTAGKVARGSPNVDLGAIGEQLRPDPGVGVQSGGDLERGLAAEVGGVGSGFDQGHLDPKPGHLLGKTLMQRFEGPFGRVVEAHDRPGGDPRDAGYAQDMPAALLAQQGQRGLDHRERAEEVRFEFRADLRLGRLFDRAQKGIARIVDHHIQPPEVGVSLRNDGLDLFTPGHVERQRQDRIAVFFGEVGKRLHGPGGGHDSVAPRQRPLRPDAAEAA